MKRDNTRLLEEALAGKMRAAAHLMTQLENDAEARAKLMPLIYPRGGRAHVIGITGAPGVGKSTLINHLVSHYRSQGQAVGVVCIDPTSPFSGGAILGDRLRIESTAPDQAVFIRSMASRGHLGGLAPYAHNIIHLLDAMGKGIILVETVGVGQGEVEVMQVAHTTCVVTAPGLGDDIQALKAGILEIADLLIVNKADLEGAEQLKATLEGVRGPTCREGEWTPPVVLTIANGGAPLSDLTKALEAHRTYLNQEGRRQSKQRQIAAAELRWALAELIRQELQARPSPSFKSYVEKVRNRTTDPYSAAASMLQEYNLGWNEAYGGLHDRTDEGSGA